MSSVNSKIITFYSYKGGVGRTMALANVAYLLAKNHHYKVLVVDWDLEAPGLHRFLKVGEDEIKRGLIDLFYDYKALLRKEISSFNEEFIKIDDYIIKPSNELSISFLPAGKFDGEYSKRVNNFNWEDFYQNWHGFGFIEYLKKQLKNQADIILIDSRTGVTDIGGICTLQMPDTVVLLFTLNEQNISGLEMIIESILKKSAEVALQKPRLILVPSRVERTLEQEKRWEWESKAADRLGKYMPERMHLLFRWGSVPGSGNERLVRFLKDNQYIDQIENVQILKKGNEEIHVISEKRWVDIKLNEKLKKAILKISDGKTYNLEVEKENGELNIYKREKEYSLRHIKEKFIPYIGYYSFGEELAVKKDTTGELAKSLDNLTTMVLNASGFLEEKSSPNQYEITSINIKTIFSNVIRIIENSWIIFFTFVLLFGLLESTKFISSIVFPGKTGIEQFISFIAPYMGYVILTFLIISIIYSFIVFIPRIVKKYLLRLMR